MKPLKFVRFILNACVAIVYSAALSTGASAQMTEEERESIRDGWIFVFNSSVPRSEVRWHAEQAADSVGARVGHVYTYAIQGFSAKMSRQAAAQLAARNPRIKYYEPDQVARANQGVRPNAKPGSGGTQPQQTTPWGITRVKGGATECIGKTAWVIDTGIDQTHPDLNVDTGRSKNFVSSGAWKVTDGNGHGTHVAGIIGAKKNDIGVIGVCPGASVVGIRVLNDRGSGTWSDVLAGIDWVGAPGNGQIGDVANMSLGGGLSQAINDAVIYASAKVQFALAAGNESTDASSRSPASANGTNIYTVSAFASGDTWASFSNYGSPVDYAAPGVGINSTYKDGGYRTLSGTSMAAPHVAGVLLLRGSCGTDGKVVTGDPDGKPDPICVVP